MYVCSRWSSENQLLDQLKSSRNTTVTEQPLPDTIYHTDTISLPGTIYHKTVCKFTSVLFLLFSHHWLKLHHNKHIIITALRHHSGAMLRPFFFNYSWDYRPPFLWAPWSIQTQLCSFYFCEIQNTSDVLMSWEHYLQMSGAGIQILQLYSFHFIYTITHLHLTG